ncbi:MAG: DNA repair protein RecN, partial [Firmicutes bacterium]|nr:DNA repair protein RecN [Bacillota bacterium]
IELTEKIEDVDGYNLKPGEEEETSGKLTRARSFETVQKALSEAYGSICGYDDDNNAAELLQQASIQLERVAALDEAEEDLKNLAERLSAIIIDVKDIGSEVSKHINDEFTPESLSALESRMSDLLLLKRRYKTEIDDLINDLDAWKAELKELKSSDNILEELNEKRRRLADEVKEKAQKISEKRKKSADELVKKITEELTFLDMPNVKFVFDFSRDKISITGMDQVEMLISVNKGEEPKQMNKIASGGELSRIMLAVKNVLASADNVPTMIFDEIDTGISGRAAHKVGIKLSEIAQKRQVLCVTHLAQIAAMGDAHFLIEKQSDEKRTYTKVRCLDHEERKREIARIISGDSDSEITLKSAEELLSRNKSDN